jgi:spoIIIJ-associated protein
MMSTSGHTDVTDLEDQVATDETASDQEATDSGSVDPGSAAASPSATGAADVGSSDPGSGEGGSAEGGDSEDTSSGSQGSGGSSRPSRSSRGGSGSVQELEEEGDVAADYLEELLDIVDVDGDIDIDVENGRASLAIVAEAGSSRSLRRLVGPNGEVLEALQELTRLAVQASTGDRSRLMLDIAGHRAARRQVLTEQAEQACAKVKASGESLRMEPMTAFERKIVHDVVADAGLNSESEGVDPGRRVVILPA